VREESLCILYIVAFAAQGEKGGVRFEFWEYITKEKGAEHLAFHNVTVF
jgi:hypothetical protein